MYHPCVSTDGRCGKRKYLSGFTVFYFFHTLNNPKIIRQHGSKSFKKEQLIGDDSWRKQFGEVALFHWLRTEEGTAVLRKKKKNSEQCRIESNGNKLQALKACFVWALTLARGSKAEYSRKLRPQDRKAQGEERTCLPQGHSHSSWPSWRAKDCKFRNWELQESSVGGLEVHREK